MFTAPRLIAPESAQKAQERTFRVNSETIATEANTAGTISGLLRSKRKSTGSLPVPFYFATQTNNGAVQ